VVLQSVVPQNAEPLIWEHPFLVIRIVVTQNVVTQSAVNQSVVNHDAAPNVALLSEATPSLVRIAVIRYAVSHAVVLNAVSRSVAIQSAVPTLVPSSVQYAARNVVAIPDCHGHDALHVDSRAAAHVVVRVAVPW
jgi:hypothetical protein